MPILSNLTLHWHNMICATIGTNHDMADLSEECSLLSRSQGSHLLLLLQQLRSLRWVL